MGDKDLYGCTWTGVACQVGCATFESQIGCDTQGSLCAFDQDAGVCSFATHGCAAYRDIASCTTAGGACDWSEGTCFDIARANIACHATSQEECRRDPAVPIAEQIPCTWHVEETIEIADARVYTGADAAAPNSTGLCVAERHCAVFTNSHDCAQLSPRCVFNFDQGACVSSRRVREQHRLCSPNADERHRSCREDPQTGGATFCNFSFGPAAGFCQRCGAFASADACDALFSDRGARRCRAKCFPDEPIPARDRDHTTYEYPAGYPYEYPAGYPTNVTRRSPSL